MRTRSPNRFASSDWLTCGLRNKITDLAPQWRSRWFQMPKKKQPAESRGLFNPAAVLVNHIPAGWCIVIPVFGFRQARLAKSAMIRVDLFAALRDRLRFLIVAHPRSVRPLPLVAGLQFGV